MDKIEDTKLTPEQLAQAEEVSETEEYAIRKKAAGAAVDDADGAHDRAMGSNSSAVDFGRPEYYTGVKGNGL